MKHKEVLYPSAYSLKEFPVLIFIQAYIDLDNNKNLAKPWKGLEGLACAYIRKQCCLQYDIVTKNQQWKSLVTKFFQLKVMKKNTHYKPKLWPTIMHKN